MPALAYKIFLRITNMNKSMKKFTAHYLLAPILVLLSSGIWSFANATIYHVRKDGNDSSCNGSANTSSAYAPNCAFLTIQKGVNVAKAGDTVDVHAGDYSSTSITTVASGTSANSITIEEAPGETATIGAFTINSGHDYITVQGFQVTNFQGTQGLFKLNGKYSKILNNMRARTA